MFRAQASPPSFAQPLSISSPASSGASGWELSAAKRARVAHPAIFPGSAKPARPRAGIAFVALILLALPISGCGKKGPPNPPPGVPDTYPRSYPRE
jgi:hypothetical protein